MADLLGLIPCGPHDRVTRLSWHGTVQRYGVPVPINGRRAWAYRGAIGWERD
jgi:hypothetical protein